MPRPDREDKLTRQEVAYLTGKGGKVVRNSGGKVALDWPGLTGPIHYQETPAWARQLIRELKQSDREAKR